MDWCRLRSLDIPDGPPTVPPISEARFPSCSVDSSIRTDHKYVKLVRTSRNRCDPSARGGPAAIQFPPAMPTICKRWLPCRCQDHTIYVSRENIYLVSTSGDSLYHSPLRYSNVPYRPPTVPPISEARFPGCRVDSSIRPNHKS